MVEVSEHTCVVPVITTTVLPTSATKTAPAPELKTSAASDQLQSTSVTTTEEGSSNSNSTETVVDNKAASSKNSSAATFLGHDDEEGDAVSFIQAALRAHDLRSRSGQFMHCFTCSNYRCSAKICSGDHIIYATGP